MWLLLPILVLVHPFVQCRVEISPSGTQYIAINTPRSITCRIERGVMTAWAIILKDGPEQRIELVDMPGITGITGITATLDGVSTLIITVNTSDTSVTGLRCEGFIIGNGTTNNCINLTIYGVPDLIGDLNMVTMNNSLMTSWAYRIIPTVTVMFNISLTFLSPSQLEDITVYVNDTDSYTFTLEGVRSCDPFTMCITATNTVGQSDPSCVNNSLPYIPSTDNITYLLSREENSYSLNLTIQMSECQEDDDLFYIAFLQNNNKNQVLTSQVIPAGPVSTTVITELFRKSLYNLTIISNGSLGVGFSEPQRFCTNDVQGVTVCSTMMDGVFNISCDYVSGCNYSGCSYELSSTNLYINGSIIGKNYDNISINVNTIYNLTVIDSNKEVVTMNELFNISSVASCFIFITTEDVIPNTMITIEKSNNGTIVVAVTIPVLIVAIIVAILTIILVIHLLRNGYCSNWGLLLFHKSNVKKGSDLYLEHHGSGNPHVFVKTENGSPVDLNKITTPDEATNDVMYDSLTTIKNRQKIEEPNEEKYSHIGTMPIYHVLEQGKALATPTQETVATKAPPTEEILEDKDAPPIPQYNPEGVNTPPIPQNNSDHHNSPSIKNVAMTNSSPADIMYAEVGIKSAAKT